MAKFARVYEIEESMEKNRISNISTVGTPQAFFLNGIGRTLTYSCPLRCIVILDISPQLCLNLSLLLLLKPMPKWTTTWLFYKQLLGTHWYMVVKSSRPRVVALTKESILYTNNLDRSSSPKGPALCNHCWKQAIVHWNVMISTDCFNFLLRSGGIQT